MHHGAGSSQGGTRRVGPAAGGEAAVEAIGTLAATLQLTLCDQHAQTVAGRAAESSQGTGASTSSCCVIGRDSAISPITQMGSSHLCAVSADVSKNTSLLKTA